MVRTTPVLILAVLIATAATADVYISGRSGGLSQTNPPAPQGDAYTRTNPQQPFASNPRDAFHDTTIQRNQPKPEPDRSPHRRHPKPGSELR